MFIGPFEHHSNELPWRESIADVVVIREDADGHIDLAELERAAEAYADRPLQDRLVLRRLQRHRHRLDTCAIADLLHRYGALSFWDFAAAAPYVDIEMVRRPAATTRWRTRTRSSCRRTSSSAAPARRACWSRGARC